MEAKSTKYRFLVTLYLTAFDCIARRIVFVCTPLILAASEMESHKGLEASLNVPLLAPLSEVCVEINGVGSASRERRGFLVFI